MARHMGPRAEGRAVGALAWRACLTGNGCTTIEKWSCRSPTSFLGRVNLRRMAWGGQRSAYGPQPPYTCLSPLASSLTRLLAPPSSTPWSLSAYVAWHARGALVGTDLPLHELTRVNATELGERREVVCLTAASTALPCKTLELHASVLVYSSASCCLHHLACSYTCTGSLARGHITRHDEYGERVQFPSGPSVGVEGSHPNL